MKKFAGHSSGHRLSLRIAAACLLITLFVACIPARTPENLANTPGAPAVITDEEYTGMAFRVRYPAGWRVIKGAASDIETVTFSGETCQVIHLYVGRAPLVFNMQGCESMHRASQSLSLDDADITVVGFAPESAWDAFEPIFDRVVQSLQAP